MNIQLLLKSPYKWLATFLLLFISMGSVAQKVVVINKVLDGSQGKIVKDATVNVQDSMYMNTDIRNQISSFSVKNIVTFHINEYANNLLPDSFRATANLRIIYLRPDGRKDSLEQVLKINYADSLSYTSRTSFVFNNAHDVTVKVLGVTISNDSAKVIQALMIENEMDIQAVYNITCTVDTVKSITAVPVTDAEADEFTVRWEEVPGADEYDLEWTFVDTSAIGARKYGTPINSKLIFLNNASRVTVKNNSYNIPLLFEGPGVVFFRVRAVQARSGKGRLETAWIPGNPMSGKIDFAGHQQLLNWQSNVAFAEEGKRNVTVGYFDGSLRSRQTVTKDNTTNTTIVGETFYDQQGRAAVNVMPAPTLSTAIKYSRNFNQANDGSEYDKSKYDYLASPADFLNASAAKMSANSGANQYYSPNNPQKDEGNNRFIPDAEGYAFSETSYTQDGTGRISRQGGVGATFQLNSGHEVKYYYDSPGDNDLDILFGTDAGDKSHYFKNTIQDANGQMSVTYVDMHGRTVATALAGKPENAQMDTLESYEEFFVTDTLSRANSNLVKDFVLESTHSQLVTMKGPYHFHYAVMPPVLRKPDCLDSIVCYPVLYDLEITVTDDVYNQHLGGQPYTVLISKYNPDSLRLNCSPDSLVADFTLELERGSYQVTKRLVINQEALAHYRDSIFMQRNVCYDLAHFVAEQRREMEQCIPDCQACRDQVGNWETYRSNYVTNAGIATADTASYRGQAMAAYKNAVEACAELCDSVTEQQSLLKAMLADVTAPSGQYANIDDSSKYSIFYYDEEKENDLAPYMRDTVSFLDDAGRLDSVYDELLGIYVAPGELSPERFAAKFKTSWADSLLKFHPEYCRYLKYKEFEASLAWNERFQSTNTYAEAKIRGFLNPLGLSAIPFPSDNSNKDPLASVAESVLSSKLLNYTGAGGSNALSMYSLATIMVKCTEANANCFATYNTPAKAFDEQAMCDGDLDMAWRSFRQLYIQYKKHIVDSIVLRANCPGMPTTAALIADGKQPHFTEATDAYTMANIKYVTGPAGAASDSVKAAMRDSYAANCHSYVSAWLTQLLACTYYPADSINNVIIPQLEAVCREGSDSAHILGSSSVKPASTYRFRSFTDVINWYNQAHHITALTTLDSMNCNSLVITAPGPYELPRAYSDKVTNSKLTDCECDKLHVLELEYGEYRTSSDTSLATYLNRTRGTSLTNQQVGLLQAACDKSNPNCTYLTSSVMVPPLIQCNTAPACATCADIDALYTTFKVAYPGVKPTNEETTQLQQNMNLFFASYMNNGTGYNKQAWEYLEFMDTCKKVTSTDKQVCESDSTTTLNSMHTYTSGDSIVLWDIVTTSDGFLLGGQVKKTRAEGGDKDGYLVKTDLTGKVIWAKRYGNGKDDYFKRVHGTRDGGFIAIGASFSSRGTGSGRRDTSMMFIVKTDSLGKMEWTTSNPLSSSGDGTDILQTDDGGYVFAARRNVSRPVKGEIGALDKDGKMKWVNTHFGGSADMEGFSLALHGDTMLVAGCQLGRIVTTGNYFTMFVTKVDVNTGDLLGHKFYGRNSQTVGNYSKHIWRTSYGYLFNFTASNLGSSGINGNTNVVVGIDWNLNMKFAKGFGSIYGGGSSGMPRQWAPIVEMPDKGLLSVQNYDLSPQQALWGRLGANLDQRWSAWVDGREYTDIQMLTSFEEDRYAAVGTRGTKGLLMLTKDTASVDCNNTTANNRSVDVPMLVSDNAWSENKYDSASAASFFVDPAVIATDMPTVHTSLKCKVTNCYTLHSGPLLCGNATPVFPTIIDSLTNCTDNETYAISAGTEIYNAYRDSLSNAFTKEYIDTALAGGQREVFTLDYNTSEYHYTLYYYDQAGNLVKTIPPAGVVLDRSPEWSRNVKNARAARQNLTPPHIMATEYKYNTLNQVVSQTSPDGGTSHFWYDRLGRMAYSQNAKQKTENKYSYTTYDALGRVNEVGELTSTTAMTDFISRDDQQDTDWAAAVAPSRTQIVKTVYDTEYGVSDLFLQQDNLRNRISWVSLYDNAASLVTANGLDYATATFYTYDIHGNVKSLVQDFKQGKMVLNGNRHKIINYDYDLISGKVNWVGYQPGMRDAFYHRYTYDALNRLTDVETSRDSIYWDKEAFYQYYKHGPLARAVIGQEQVQGIDYAYTLQGWLKGTNSTALTPIFDMGGDGTANSLVAKDAFGSGLHYYGVQDYKSINNTVMPFAAAVDNKPLYNGNISTISQHIPSVGKSLEFNYSYDNLNRLKGMQAATGLDSLTNSWTNSYTRLSDFGEAVTYDPNGNILRYHRNGNHTFAGGELAMDSLEYHYRAGTNKLTYITDTVNAANYGTDIDNQLAGNYEYDSIGNLIADHRAGIKNIEWTVYGKIKTIKKNDSTTIHYTYDVAGNRISKIVDSLQTWYVRDGSGNVMSIYTSGDSSINNGKLSQTEAHMYGSSRLGILNLSTNVEDSVPPVAMADLGLGTIKIGYFVRGKKSFELSNHLGNVLATVSDKKMGISYDNNTLDHYEPLILSSQEYYPFGMLMPGRGSKLVIGQYENIGPGGGTAYPTTLTVDHRENNTPSEYVATDVVYLVNGFESATGDDFVAYIGENIAYDPGPDGHVDYTRGAYRYGFNGKENDNEVKGDGNQQDYGMRVYDPRIGKFLSVDPLSQHFPWFTPYQFAGNKPIWAIDLDGAEELIPFFAIEPPMFAGVGEMVEMGVGVAEASAVTRVGIGTGAAGWAARIGPIAPAETIATGVSGGGSWGTFLLRAPYMGPLIKPLDNNTVTASQQKPTTLKQPQVNPRRQFNPQKAPTKDNEEDPEQFYIYETGRSIKAGKETVIKSTGDLPYFGITSQPFIGGRYKKGDETVDNYDKYKGIIGKADQITALGVEAALIALNTYGKNFELRALFNQMSTTDVKKSTRIDNLRFQTKNPVTIALGIKWLEDNVGKNWKDQFLHPENKKGKNHSEKRND